MPDDEHASVGELGDQVVEDGEGSRDAVATALAVGQRAARRRAHEGLPFVGEPLGDLVGRESLGVAEVDLDEALVDAQRRDPVVSTAGAADRRARLSGDATIASRLRLDRPGAERGGLSETVPRERDIRIAGVPVLRVPDRLAVPREEERRHPSTPDSLFRS